MIRWYGSVHVFNFEQNKLVRVSQQPKVPLVAGASTKQQSVVVPLAAFPNQLSKSFINSTNVQRNYLSPSLSPFHHLLHHYRFSSSEVRTLIHLTYPTLTRVSVGASSTNRTGTNVYINEPQPESPNHLPNS